MDYEADKFGANGEGESKRVGEVVSEESVAGSDQTKGLEAEYVFQEAMEPREQVHDQGSKLNSEDAVVDEQDDTETGSALTSALADGNTPDAVQEPDSFEQAVGADTDSGKLGEDEVIAKQDLEERDGQGNDYVPLDGVDSGVPGDGEICDESCGVGDDNLESSDGGDGKEESGLNSDREMLVLENGSMVDGNSGLVSEKAEIDDSEFMTPRENGGIVLDNGSTDEVDGVATEAIMKSESSEVIPAQGTDAGDLKECAPDPELGDDKIEVKLNASVDPSGEIQDDTSEEVHGNSAHMTLEHQDEVTRDMKDDSLGTNMSHKDRNGEEMSTDGIQNTEIRDCGNGYAEAGSSPPFLENSSNQPLSVQEASAAEPKEASNKDDQSQISDEEHRDHDNTSVVEEPESIQEKIIQVTGEQHVQPAADISSSSERSAGTVPTPVRPSSENSAAAGPTPVHPTGLGRAAPLLEPASRVVQQPRANGTVSNSQSQQMEDSSSGEAEEYDETREKLQMIRVKFLRLAHRLGQTPHNVVVAQVLYRLGLAEQLRGRNGGRVGAFSFDRASAMAEQLEAAGQEPLDFSCTIMVLGKTGVGKSATINSIFDEVKFNTSAFHMGTKKVQDVVGTVQGIKVRVIDTPGLLPSWADQRSNEKILQSVKHFIKKTPPDIVLYLDRLDMQSRDFSDMPLLRTITEIFGPSIWFNAIVVLTHAASAPPEGPNGTASSYDTFVTQRSHVVQQAIRQAAGDMRLMNPVSLVENHSACRTNRAGQRVLPNGQVWKPHLLLLSFASKILAEANALLKLQDSPPGKPYVARARAPPLPFLLSTLLQSRPQLKLPEEQFGDEDSLDDDLDESSESDDENEHDDLPPFKPLTKAQVEKLSKAHKKAYFDELEYREKLLMKKQLKEEKKRRKMLKKMAESAKDLPSDHSENVEEESGGAASVPVPMPDLALPASFDSDNPTHRYRYLDSSSNQWLVRPVLETHGWDHDVGYEGLNVERLFVLKEKIPLSFSGQVTKDKKDANVQMEISSSVKHGKGKATSLGFDLQTVGKDLAYTLRSETRFTNFRRNNATAGLSFTLLGDALSSGLKIEDKLVASKRFKLVVSGGAMTGRGDIAYGGSLEAQLRDKDYPLGRFLTTLGLSVMDWHGDLAVGYNVQSQIPVGRYTNLVARANLNNRGAGQISIRLNSSEQLQIALIGLIPLLKKLVGYHQQLQFGQY
ncbi:translocase of chloroplast 120, chloroplastic-like [Glycine soja]|nr:translocase of chloroplast 120, chloroplastic-like [Glycine soja]RZB74020.1 Translocase of chloroplast 132, chloroplastic isoform B [Glycine soja]